MPGLSALWAPGSCRRFTVAWRGLALLMALRIALGPYRALAGQPEALFRPVSFLKVLDAMPSVGVFVVLQVVGAAAATWAVARGPRRRGGRMAFVAAWVAYLVLAGLRSSLGKILHNDVLLLLAAVPFVLAWTSDGEDERGCGWPVRAAITVVATAYFAAGVAKLRHSGIAWVTGDNMRYILSWAVVDGRMRFDRWTAWVSERAWLCTLSALGILGLEVGAPVAVAVRAMRPLFTVSAVLLHAVTWVLLGLDYWAWMGTVVVVLVDWDGVLGRDWASSTGRVGGAAPSRT